MVKQIVMIDKSVEHFLSFGVAARNFTKSDSISKS